MGDLPIQARGPGAIDPVEAAPGAGEAAAASQDASAPARAATRVLSGGFTARDLEADLHARFAPAGGTPAIAPPAPSAASSPSTAASAPAGYADLDAAREGSYVEAGSSGAPVEALQRALEKAGLDVPATGKFDAATLAAVKQFQQAHGCKVDGIVGPETLGAMDKALGLPAYAPPAPSTVGPAGPVAKTGNAFIDSIAAGAVESQRQTGVPASVTIAQAILESGWGKSGLSKDHFNFFGIKGTGPAGSANLPTQEFLNGKWVTVNADFRAYHNAAESLTDHAKLLANGKPYKKAMADRANPEQFARDLTGVYATDPNYGDKLVSIMKQYGLTRFDAAAGGPPASAGS